MYKNIFKKGEVLDLDKPQEGDSAFFENPDGTLSNESLHDQIMEGVDPRVGREFARGQLKETLTLEQLDMLYPMSGPA